MERNWFEGMAGGAPTVAADDIVRLHFEEDWREYFTVADFHPLYLQHVPKVMLVTAPPELSLSVEYGRLPSFLGPWAVVFTQNRPLESRLPLRPGTHHGLADPDAVLATIDAALYRWRPPLATPSENRPISWLAALWTYHVDDQGQIVASDGSDPVGDDRAIFIRSVPDQLREGWRREGVSDTDMPPIGDANEQLRLLIPMLRAIALWNTGQAELNGDRLELVRPHEARPPR